jgi:hypothetical protein
MNQDKYIKDDLTIEQIYRSFERRKRQKKIKFRKELKYKLFNQKENENKTNFQNLQNIASERKL